MSSRKPPILCLDFDGVINSYATGWSDSIPDPPTPGTAQFLYDAQQAGFRIVVVSSRFHHRDGKVAVSNYVWRLLDDEFGTNVADAVHMSIDFSDTRPPAFVTLDDRALTFTGTWPSIETLKAFQPWHKKVKDGSGEPADAPQYRQLTTSPASAGPSATPDPT
jgi:hypothetical protein